MPSYPIVPVQAFGATYAVPAAVSRLPIDLLRTSLVTRDPAAAQAAMVQYRAAMQEQNFQPAALMPQRMMFQQHKPGPSGVARGNMRSPFDTAQSLQAAMNATQVTPGVHGLSGSTLRTVRVPGQVPTYDQAAAARARGSQYLPVPELAPLPVDNVQARVRPVRQPTGAPLEAYGQEIRAMEQSRAMDRASDTEQAMQSVAALRQGFRRMLGLR